MSRAPQSDSDQCRSPIDHLTRPDVDRARVDLAAWEREWQMVPVSQRVPESIRQRVDVARDLMRYSYFRYGFADVAFLYIMLTYEAALRDLYKVEVLTFEQLITSAVAGHIIPERYPEWKVQAARKLRNALAHGRARIPGLTSIRMILNIIDLINAVYDEEARINAPPAFAREILGRKRERLMWEALNSLPENSSPDDTYVWVGGEQAYPAGRYECTSCGSVFMLKSTSLELPVCRKCRKGLFRLTERPAGPG